MKILLLGATGFLGSHISDLLSQSHEVIATTRNKQANTTQVQIDLLIPDTIIGVLTAVRPDAIINCAGVITNDETAYANVLYSKNLLESVERVGLRPNSIIIAGSASVYGEVDSLPVDENTPLRATSQYGISKAREEEEVLQFAEAHGLRVVIARIFNPIGPGMKRQQLLPSIMEQVGKIRAGGPHKIEVSRLDSKRDYIDVRDVARAIKLLVEHEPRERLYNIGSGVSTSNKDLIELVVAAAKLDFMPSLHETVKTPEKLVASQADIRRLVSEFGWRPQYTPEETIKEIMYAHSK